MPDPFSPPPTTESLERVQADVETPVHEWGPAIEVSLPRAATPVPVAHGLDGIPNGWVTWFQSGGVPLAVRVPEWTHDIAWLAGSADNVTVRLSFIMLRNEVRNG